jgi:hypothetical protein
MVLFSFRATLVLAFGGERKPVWRFLGIQRPRLGGHAIDLGIARRDFKTGPTTSISPFLAAAHAAISMNAR